MATNFADLNSDLLATLSAGFLICNGITSTDAGLVKALSGAVFSNINAWYRNQGRTFNPDAELVEEEAIRYAFGRVQMIADLAKAAADQLAQ